MFYYSSSEAPAHRGAQHGDMLYEAEYPASHARVTQMVYSGSRNKEMRKQETGPIPRNPKMAMEPAVPSSKFVPPN